MANSRFEIQVEVITDDENKKYIESYNPTTKKYTYTPIPIRYILDNSGNETINLNYNISDVSDIATKVASYSKTFRLPASKQNRTTFQSLAEMGFDEGYNSNRKAKAYVIVDSVIVFDGYLQYKEYNTTAGQDAAYEIVIYAATQNFFSNLGEIRLEDLDYSDLKLTKWNYVNIVDSWDPNKVFGYFYPLIDYNWNLTAFNVGQPWAGITLQNTPGLFPENFYPALYLKTYLDKIFSYSGYRYKSKFFASDMFSKLIIPYNGPKTITRRDINENVGYEDKPYDYDKKFYVGRTPGTYGTNTFNHMIGFYESYLVPGQNSNLPITVELQEYTLKWNEESTTFGFSDLFNRWNPGIFTYTKGSLNQEGFAQKFKMGIRMIGTSIPSGLAGHPSYPGFHPDNNVTRRIEIRMYRQRHPVTGVTDPTWFSGRGRLMNVWIIKAMKSGTVADPDPNLPPVEGIEWGLFTNTLFGAPVEGFQVQLESPWLSTSTYLDPLEMPNVTQLFDGEQMRVNMRIVTGYDEYNSSISPLKTALDPVSWIKNEISLETVNNGTYDVNACIIPKNVKARDVMASLINQFNLYVEPSKEDPNTLIIEPREDFFNLGPKVDWSQKVDLNQPIALTPTAATQNKSIKFLGKESDDWANTAYTDFRKEQYGQYTYVNNSDFSNGEKIITQLFAPSPTVGLRNSNSIFVPQLSSVEAMLSDNDSYPYLNGTNWYPNKPTVDFKAGPLRLLFSKKRQGIYDLNMTLQTWFKFNYAFNINQTGANYLNFYPYAGNLDDIYNPKFDINWWYPKDTFYILNNTKTYTNKNLVGLYWMDHLNELMDPDGRILTCYMNLSPVDMEKFTFTSQVFVRINHPQMSLAHGSYFRVNSITEYDPSNRGFAKVELLKINPGTYGYARNIQGSTSVIHDGNWVPFPDPGPVVIGPGGSPTPSHLLVNGGGFNTGTTGFINYVNSQLNQNYARQRSLSPLNRPNINTNSQILTNNQFNALPTQGFIDRKIDSGNHTILPYGGTTLINNIDAGVDSVIPIGSASFIQIIDGGLDMA